MDFQKEFEFTVSNAKLEFDNPPAVHRVHLVTDAAPKGKITIKARKQVEKEKSVDGMPGFEEQEEMYDAEELPENIKNVVRKAQEQELTCVATVAKNEDDHMFILDEHIETLEARLLQDNGGEE